MGNVPAPHQDVVIGQPSRPKEKTVHNSIPSSETEEVEGGKLKQPWPMALPCNTHELDEHQLNEMMMSQKAIAQGPHFSTFLNL